ncbi:MAG: tRNA (adenosine(37)-N6)-threonylcarbamoyltransferase complex dimerization subunit type 1 TsaB [Bacteroidales bacterium]|nr:tRNA (adenosine(37)-N6)-threonylcarbamoyltransferase complex dimerization subunit type 1 TsaB [Bacteroidales bacterium]
MSKILQIETTSEICSVAISDNGKTLESQVHQEKQKHSAVLTLLIEKALKNTGLLTNELDAIAVSRGPGSYTGLRIGVSVAKGMCYAANLPLLSVNTLKAMSLHVLSSGDIKDRQETLLCPMLDARRMEVYQALYNTRLDSIKGIHAANCRCTKL